MATAFLGDCRMPAAVLLVAQACKSGVALLASQSPVIDPDKEEAAAEPYEDGSGGRLISLGSPSPLLDVLALNVGKDCVLRSSEKFTCRLDVRSCGVEKVGRCYLGAGSLVRKRAHSGQLGLHHSLVSTAILDKRKCRGLRSPYGPIVAGSSLPLPFSLARRCSR